jgi:hypothetical protein
LVIPVRLKLSSAMMCYVTGWKERCDDE